MADVKQGQDGGTSGNAGGGAGGSAETVETLTAKLAESERRRKGLDSAVTDFDTGKRVPKHIEDRLRGEGFGELDEVLELAKKAKSGGTDGAGRPQIKHAADGAPIPPKRSDFVSPETGEVDEDALFAAQTAYSDARQDWKAGADKKASAAQVEVKAVGTSVQTLLKSLPKAFQAKDGDGDRLTAALAGLAAHNAIGDFATPEEIAATTAELQDLFDRYAVATWTERKTSEDDAKGEEATHTNIGSEPKLSAETTELLKTDPVKAGVAALAARRKTG